MPAEREGTLQLLAVERRRSAVLRTVVAALTGRLGVEPVPGVHLVSGSQIRIEDNQSDVIMDGEHFRAAPGKALVMTPSRAIAFVDLARGASAGEGCTRDVSLVPQPVGAAAPKAAIASRLHEAR